MDRREGHQNLTSLPCPPVLITCTQLLAILDPNSKGYSSSTGTIGPSSHNSVVFRMRYVGKTDVYVLFLSRHASKGSRGILGAFNDAEKYLLTDNKGTF